MYTYQTKVTASCTGRDGYLTPVSLLSMMQDCSQLQLDSEQALGSYFKEQKLTLMLASRQVDIMRYPVYAENLEISTGIYDCKPSMGFRCTSIMDEQGEFIAKSWSVGAVVSLETAKLARISKEVLSSIEFVEKPDMEYLSRRIALPSSEPVAEPHIVARPSDIDFNQHVNNVQFIRMAAEHLPLDFKPERLRIEYKMQAKEGERIFPLVHPVEDGVLCIQLVQEEGAPYAVVEFMCGEYA